MAIDINLYEKALLNKCLAKFGNLYNVGTFLAE